MPLPPDLFGSSGMTPVDYLTAIVESSQDAIVSKNLDGIVTSWNRGAEQVFGYTAEEMIGRPIAILAAPEVGSEMPKILERIARGERVEHYETIRQRKDGRRIHVSLTVSPVRDSTGKIIGASKIARDITERKRLEAERNELLERERTGREAAEQAMRLHREAERNLALLVDASDRVLASLKMDDVLPRTLELARRFFPADACAVWRVDPEKGRWRILAGSGLSAEFLATEASNPPGALSQPVTFGDLDLECPPDRAPVLRREGMRALMAAPMKVEGRPFGAFSFYFRAPREFTETDCRMVVALANLTASAINGAESYEEQRRLQDEAQAQAARSKLLARISGVVGSSLDFQTTLRRVATLAVPEFADWCSVHMLTPDGSIRHMAVHHSDPRKAELARRLLDRHPPSLDNIHGIGQVLRTGRPEVSDVASWNGRGRHRDRHFRLLHRIHLRSTIVVPMVARGRTLGVITFATAESRRDYTPADLAIAEQLAAAAALAIDNAGLFAEMENRRAEAESTARALRQSNEELERFAYVSSHDLKEPLRTVTSYAQLLSKKYRGRLDRDADEFLDFMVDGALWMNTLIDAVLSYSRLARAERLEPEPVDMESALASAQVNLRGIINGALSVTHDRLPTVLGDRAQLVQVFQNLLSNAMRYRGDAAGRVHVSASRSGTQFRFSVADNGIGISEQYWNRVFELFLRLHSRPVSGAGIGLALCKKIVERHGGRIWLESKPGGGTTVYFTLTAA